jgi:hypothetical protein
MGWISIMRSLYFKIFSAPFLTTFCLHKFHHPLTCIFRFNITHYDVRFIIRHGSASLHCWCHNMLPLPSRPVSINFGTYMVIPLFPVSLYTHPLHMLKCSWSHNLSYLSMYCSFATIAHVDLTCSVVSANCLRSAFAISFEFIIIIIIITEVEGQKTYLLTPWSTVLLEKPTGSQLVKKFPAFYGTRRFITAFTSARHLPLSWASSKNWCSKTFQVLN